MTGTAIVRSGNDMIDTATGEVRLDMGAYLARLASKDSINEQKALATAYDTACASLIGENDVQKEGGRTFKKKSAWRKLARHFNISTAVVNVQKESVGEAFLATVTVRASAPWGQYAESVGACGTDEATGRRTITIADAVATAETRATNRAVSNLVAMGEVSAEEMSKGNNGTTQHRQPAPGNVARALAPNAPNTPSGTPAFRTFPLPFGKSKNTPLMDMEDDNLLSALQWAQEKQKFNEFQDAATKELAFRDGGANGGVPYPGPLVEDADILEAEEIPF